MSARLLEHVNIRTTRLRETVRFYEEVLGLRSGHYPGKAVPGAWIYDVKGVPVVHIVAIDPFDADVQKKADIATVSRPLTSLNGTGVIDHVAFAAEDYDAFLQRIEARGLAFRTRAAVAGLRQIYIMDPNDVLIELNFRTTENV
jgi:catechol 2,3-dioxygenase-like lactoylglutathione lyase family enzyme